MSQSRPGCSCPYAYKSLENAGGFQCISYPESFRVCRHSRLLFCLTDWPSQFSPRLSLSCRSSATPQGKSSGRDHRTLRPLPFTSCKNCVLHLSMDHLLNALQVCPRSYAFYRPTGVSALCLLQRRSANTIWGGCFLVPCLWHSFHLGSSNVSQSHARCSVNPMTPAHFKRSIVGYRPSGCKDSGTSCQSRQMLFAFSKSLDLFILEISCQGS